MKADVNALKSQEMSLARLPGEGATPSGAPTSAAQQSTLPERPPVLACPEVAAPFDLLSETLASLTKPTNVAQVRQLSPFRYPGGKTWLVPEVRQWLKTSGSDGAIFIEPFAGGAMAGLTAAAEGLCEKVVLGEIDDDVAAVWQTIFHAPRSEVNWLCREIRSFDVNLPNVRGVLNSPASTRRTRAFRTIVKNRMQRGGIMAPGAGLVKEGEAGKGLRSRWYPDTLAKRIEALFLLRGKISFLQRDAFDMIKTFADDPAAMFFVDPPYTAGGKRAGSRLYSHNDVDHEALFSLLASVQGAVMLTYDDAPEVRAMAARHAFRVEAIPMKNTHHAVMRELLIFKASNGADALVPRPAPISEVISANRLQTPVLTA
jgi:DNA adenine methylase